jgi:hypothetical protein
MLEKMDIMMDGENLTGHHCCATIAPLLRYRRHRRCGQSPFSLHSVSIIPPQVICKLGMEISFRDAKVNRM